jgi:lipopolysaccharide assembly outer membrane protein LptD (OstA)
MIRTILALAAVVAVATPLAAAAPPGSPKPKPKPAPHAASRGSNAASNPGQASFDLGVWTVHASSLDANFKNGDFSTPNKVVMTREGGDVSADRANGNYKKQVLFLNGHVVMHDSQGNVESMAGGGQPRAPSPSTLTADQAQIDGMAKVYKAIGNVHYVQADTVVNANTGTLNDTDHTLLLEGAVHITEGSRSMNAQRVLYNTETGSAHAQGDVTMQFPSPVHRTLATPRPLHIPKNAITQPVSSAPP